MRSVLGVLGLVVVLAIVGLVARRQLSAVAPVPAAAGGPARESPRQVEERARAELVKAMEAAASATRERADP
jgi:hypothetical protein